MNVRLFLSTILLLTMPHGPDQPSAQTYKDPAGRYALSLPPGWTSDGSGDGVMFHHGTGWAQVRLLNAAAASEAVDRAVSLYKGQFATFSTINRGDTTIGGRPSHGLNVDATTTGGERVSVLFTAQPLSPRHYFVLISSTPIAQAPLLNSSVMTLAASAHFASE